MSEKQESVKQDTVSKPSNNGVVLNQEEEEELKKGVKNEISDQVDNEEDKNPEEQEDQVDDSDERSIFVKNVDYSADVNELKDHFKECGEIKRVTILYDKLANQPKGQAYVEFSTREGVQQAKRLDESLFKGRQITVMTKRKNIPGRGRGGRGGKNIQQQLLQTMMMVLGRGGRGRGRGGRGRGFKPY